MTRVRVASIHDIPEGTGRELLLGRIPIVVWNIAGRFHATAARCPHEDAPLCIGSLEGAVVTCPMHGWQFDVTTGQGVNPPDRRLRPYPVHVDDESIYIDTA
jgi:nitrite reductase (NADH) small subunit